MSSGVCQAPIVLSSVRDNSCSCIENFLKFIHHELRGSSQKTAAVVKSTTKLLGLTGFIRQRVWPMSAVKCPATDLYPNVANNCQRLWQAEWDGCVSNKLHSVKPLLGYSNLSSLSRQDAVVLRRLRIGHSRLTHSYLLNRQDHPQCSHCDCALTVAQDLLLECNHYNVVRQRYFSVSSLHELFDTVDTQNILGFIRYIGLYRLL